MYVWDKTELTKSGGNTMVNLARLLYLRRGSAWLLVLIGGELAL
jgi:hypothetical protein